MLKQVTSKVNSNHTLLSIFLLGNFGSWNLYVFSFWNAPPTDIVQEQAHPLGEDAAIKVLLAQDTTNTSSELLEEHNETAQGIDQASNLCKS